jgi:quercetin dioxygenase-like cupin family protein
LIFALYEHPDGVETDDRRCVVYDLERNVALRGAARTDGPSVVWAFHEARNDVVTDRYKDASLAAEVELDPNTEWLVRCDRVDFPPGGVAYRHVHPGPGIRRLLFGELTIESDGETHTFRKREAWLEAAEQPVLATASATEETAFVRVLLLPAEWAGRRTIRYLDPADEDRPKLQRAAILLEEPLRL